QLELDRATADGAGLEIECVEGDIDDLSMLAGRRFDLVHQPICSCYIPDLTPAHHGVRSLLAPGGWYDVEHWNPVHAQLEGYGGWRGGRLRLPPPARGVTALCGVAPTGSTSRRGPACRCRGTSTAAPTTRSRRPRAGTSSTT